MFGLHSGQPGECRGRAGIQKKQKLLDTRLRGYDDGLSAGFFIEYL